jgi:ABC-type Mn2+/Zn2+ transport system permease subunit
VSDAFGAIAAIGWTPFMAGFLLAVLCAILSVQVVLHRIVFLAAALGQAAAAGIALGLLVEGHHPPLYALGVCLLVVLSLGGGVGQESSTKGKANETSLGVLYVAGAAASVLLVNKSAAGREEVMHLLEGDMLFTGFDSLLHLVLIGSVVLLFLAACSRHLTLVGFHPERALVMGYRIRLWRGALLMAVAAVVAPGLETGGMLLTFGCLVIPGATALLWTRSLGRATALAAMLAGASLSLGYVVSFLPSWDEPPAATTVAILVVLYLLSRNLRSRE